MLYVFMLYIAQHLYNFIFLIYVSIMSSVFSRNVKSFIFTIINTLPVSILCLIHTVSSKFDLNNFFYLTMKRKHEILFI